MKKVSIGLAVVLVAQILFAAVLKWSDASPSNEQKALLSDSAAVNKVVLSDAEQQVTLWRRDGGWVVEQLEKLPADQSKVKDALHRVAQIRLGFPITATQSAHERFEVDEGKFQRKITLYKDENQPTEILLGTSPGFREVHLRIVDEDETYAVELNAFDFPAEPDQWLDKQLLALDSPTQIQGNDYKLVRQAEKWVLQSEQGLDETKADDLVAAIEGLRILEVAAPLEGENVQEIEVLVASGEEAFTYKFQSNASEYRVSRDDRQAVFRLSQSEFDSIAGVTLTELQAALAEKPALDEEEPKLEASSEEAEERVERESERDQ